MYVYVRICMYMYVYICICMYMYVCVRIIHVLMTSGQIWLLTAYEQMMTRWVGICQAFGHWGAHSCPACAVQLWLERFEPQRFIEFPWWVRQQGIRCSTAANDGAAALVTKLAAAVIIKLGRQTLEMSESQQFPLVSVRLGVSQSIHHIVEQPHEHHIWHLTLLVGHFSDLFQSAYLPPSMVQHNFKQFVECRDLQGSAHEKKHT